MTDAPKRIWVWLDDRETGVERDFDELKPLGVESFEYVLVDAIEKPIGLFYECIESSGRKRNPAKHDDCPGVSVVFTPKDGTPEFRWKCECPCHETKGVTSGRD